MLESKDLCNYSLVVFDLDDTLYKETDYLFSAYREIEQYVSEKAGIPFGEVDGYLKTSFLIRGRDGLFDDFLIHFGVTEIIDKTEMLDILRTHSCNLHFFKHTETLLSELHKCGKKIALLTNGNLIQQKNKVKCLRIQTLFPYIDIVYATEVAPKPSPEGLFLIAERNGCLPKEIAFIGDSLVDEETAKNAGVSFYYI